MNEFIYYEYDYYISQLYRVKLEEFINVITAPSVDKLTSFNLIFSSTKIEFDNIMAPCSVNYISIKLYADLKPIIWI